MFRPVFPFPPLWIDRSSIDLFLFLVFSRRKVFYVPIDFSMSFALFLTCFFCFFQGRYAERRTISRRKCWVVKDTDMKPISGQWVALCKLTFYTNFVSVFLYRNRLHQVRHVGWTAAIWDIDISWNIFENCSQYVRDSSMGIPSGTFIDPSIVGSRSSPSSYIGSSVETRFLY